MRTLFKLILFVALVWAIADWHGVARGVNAADESSAASVARAANDFGFRLLRTLAAEQDAANVIVSPFSVSQALTMTSNGARGATRTAMGRTLGIGSINGQQLNASNRQLLDALRTADRDTRLEIANALWLRKGFAVNPEFVALNKDSYHAEVQSLDFAGAPQSAVGTINAWVNRNTQGTIPSIVGKLESDTMLVLTDAVYFKGAWADPFVLPNTKPRNFFLPSGKSLTTPMMKRQGVYTYLETKDFQAIRLPYGNSQFAMYVFLPRQKGGLSGFIKTLDQPHWTEWMKKFAPRNGTLVMPKFELSYARELNAALTAMGMGVAFSKAADFSGIESSRQIYISDALHKTYVKVDEQGTEAAAATAVIMRPLSAYGVIGVPFEMIVDHPFVFAISEHESGAILFVAAVVDPARRD